MSGVGEVRRVVLGARDGRSCVSSDGLAPVAHAPGGGFAITELWATTAMPPPGDGDDPTGLGLEMSLPFGHTRFWMAEFPARNAGVEPFRHATPTLDYLSVVSGRITLELDDGEVLLEAGDTAVQRGNMHAWRNDDDEPCRIAVVMVSLAAAE